MRTLVDAVEARSGGPLDGELGARIAEDGPTKGG